MTVLLDAAGRRRSPATLPATTSAARRTTGMRYPADPSSVEEIVAVMRRAADDRHGWRVRAMIVVLWRGGLRIQEALALAEHDLDHRRGSIGSATAREDADARSAWTTGAGNTCTHG
jgi:integrase